jgi:hypothetical protein
MVASSNVGKYLDRTSYLKCSLVFASAVGLVSCRIVFVILMSLSDFGCSRCASPNHSRLSGVDMIVSSLS